MTAKVPSKHLQSWVLPVIFTTGLLSGILLESRVVSQSAPDARQTLSEEHRNSTVAPIASGTGPESTAADSRRQVDAPQLVVDEREFNFGARNEGEVIEHALILRNTGTVPLVFSQIGLNCGWVSAFLGDKVVQPGDSTNLTILARLKGRKGPQKQTLLLTSNDPQLPEYALTITGTVVSVEATP